MVANAIIEENFIEDIVVLHKNKLWSEIIEKYHGHPERNRVLWVFPSENNLCFLKETLGKLGCSRILSVGCGSGLLEWIISESTGIPTSGIEVDGAWWKCKYSPPTFLPLHFCKPDLSQDEDTKALLKGGGTALLFCYFNNKPAFDSYLKYFEGDVLVVIGPGPGRGTHTSPRPFDDVEAPWMLHVHQEVRDSKDFIAVYCRN